MKKKKPTIHITDIKILMQLMMYKKFRNYKIIYYFTYYKKKTELNYILKSEKLHYENELLLALKKKYSLNLIIFKDKLFASENFNNYKKKKIDYIVKSKIFINDEDIVSNNLYFFFKKYMLGKRIIFITEGIGLYELGKKNNFFNKVIHFLKLEIKSYTKFIKLNLYPEQIILFQDQNNWTKKYLDYYLLPFEKINLLPKRSNQMFVKAYRNIYLTIFKNLGYFFNKRYKCIYPFLIRLSYGENKTRIINLLNEHKGNILIKAHPADNRNLSKIKSISKRIILLDNDLRFVPGELFVKKNTLYCGYLSTMALSVIKKNIRFLKIKNKNYLNYAKHAFEKIESIIF